MGDKQHNKREKTKRMFKDYIYLFIGAFIVALSFNLFLNPNGIASGGVSGFSTIIEYQFGIEAAITQWGLNIPLFITGFFLLGKQFGTKTAVGSVILPFFVYMTRNFTPLTDQLLLATIYGGVGIGIGLGMIFRGKASTGGTDLIAQIVHKYTGISLGFSLLFMDGLVVFTSGIVFGLERAMYALLSLYITSKTIDMVQMGLGYSKIAFIISGKQEEIGTAILNDVNRGLTIMNATGGYTGSERKILMVVFQQKEITKLKDIVRMIDPFAFVIVANAHEVLGKGFQSNETM